MPAAHDHEEAIFHQALEIESSQERNAYLESACAGHPALLARVKTLLEASSAQGDLFDAARLDPMLTLDGSGLAEGPGTLIGRYKLLEKIGEGGMAMVYMAEQEHPVRRQVGLKIIKLGMDTKQIIARFEAERQALALMDHPNIAKVFDAGITETGRPYFVMELVRGVAITEYCDKNKLSTTDRLNLFLQVCHAVQHAHQKGIIHRDIKPSNVMVTLHDGRAQAVVIDFGIAKATSQKLTERTLFTRYAQMIGTPEYMSPEQAEMSRLDVDTRTDIYSLGVLLYELLTGSTPFGGEQLRAAGYAGIQRIICETEPQKPSTKLSTLGQTLTEIAQHRRTTAQVLPKLVRGDLDWIVMKTLEKDRTKRYETTHALVQDIERHLRNEPVAAGPPRTLDRCRKFIRRNRALVTGAAAVGVVLLAGVVVSTRFAIGQARALEASRQQADRYRAIATFLQKDVFGTLDPWRDGGRDVLIEELLATATERAQGSFGDQPLVEASIRATIGTTYQRLGKYKEAEPQLRQALELHQRLLGNRDPATLSVKLELGMLYFFSAREPEAEPIFAQVLSDSHAVLGLRHETTISAMSCLGSVYLHAGNLDEADRFCSEALKLAQDVLGPNHDMSVKGMLILGSLRLGQGRTDEAEKLLTDGLNNQGRLWGDKHPDTVHFMCNLACVYLQQGRIAEAQKMSQTALETARASFEPANRTTLVALMARAWVCFAQKDYDHAEKLLFEVRDTCKQHPDRRYWFTPEAQLAWFYYEARRYADAEPYTEQALNQNLAKWGTRRDWPSLTWILADIKFHLGHYEEGQKALADLVDAVREGRADISAFEIPSQNQVAWLLATHWKPELRNGTEAVRWATRVCDLNAGKNRVYLGTLAAAYAEANDFNAAVKWQKQAIQMLGDAEPEAVRTDYQSRLKLYESGKPYRQPEPPSGG